jgi:hypothetical protein
MGHVITGMDPHKRPATIEIIDDRETVLSGGRFGTDRDGYKAMLALGRRRPERTWAVEGCNGIGRHIAQRLVADGETVLDVPATLPARARVFATGQGRKTDPVESSGLRAAEPFSSRAGRLSGAKLWIPDWAAGTLGPHRRAPWHRKQKATWKSRSVVL